MTSSNHYTSVFYKTKRIQLDILWDDTTCWLSRPQLALLFHCSKMEFESILRKVLHIYPIEKYNHCKKIRIITIRKCAKSDQKGDWLKNMYHYDLRFLQCLREFAPGYDVDVFLRYAMKYQAHLQTKKES